MKLELIPIGNSTGLILSEELLARLHLKQGQWLAVTTPPEGGFRLTPCNPEFEQAISVVDEITDEYAGTLRALAQ